MEGAQESYEVLALGDVPGQLDRALDRLSPGVAEEDAALLLHRHDAGQLGTRLRVDRDVEVGAVMDQLAGLVPDRRHHVRVAVAGRGDRDAGVEVEKEVAVDVLYRAALAPRGDDRIGPRHARRGPLAVELQVYARLRPGQFRNEVRNAGSLSELTGSLGHGAPRQVYGGPRRAQLPQERIAFMQAG